MNKYDSSIRVKFCIDDYSVSTDKNVYDKNVFPKYYNRIFDQFTADFNKTVTRI